jgi:hypothetical protein
MDYNFQNESQLWIPKEAYQPYKRCEHCQSVYLTDNICESCGRSVRYDLIGTPFSYKSFYGMKERYINELTVVVRKYPFFENPKSLQARGFIRQLQKRLGDLAYLTEHEQKKLFDVEAFEIINELLFYSVSVDSIRIYLGNNFAYEKYLVGAAASIEPKKLWFKELLDYKFAGVLRVKFVLITSTLVIGFMYSLVFSLRSGR